LEELLDVARSKIAQRTTNFVLVSECHPDIERLIEVHDEQKDAMQEKLTESYGNVRDLEVKRPCLLQDNKDLRGRLQVDQKNRVEGPATIRELHDFNN
jgi:hypothetical protein